MARKISKAIHREAVRGMIQEWSKLAYPDAKDIPEDPEEGAAMQARADRKAAEILEIISMEGLI